MQHGRGIHRLAGAVGPLLAHADARDVPVVHHHDAIHERKDGRALGEDSPGGVLEVTIFGKTRDGWPVCASVKPLTGISKTKNGSAT